jgi:hypothetical protein
MASTSAKIEPAAKGPGIEQATYSDGSPLDDVQYLECKLILEPDRFVNAKVFFEYGKLVAES